MLQVSPGLPATAAAANDAPLPAANNVSAGAKADAPRGAKDGRDTTDTKGAKDGKATRDVTADGRDAGADAALPDLAFGAQLALQADAATQPAQVPPTLPEASADSPVAPQADPALTAAPSAEQWLASMLGQRDVSLQARDSAPATAAGSAQGVAGSGLPNNASLAQWRGALPAVPPAPLAGQALPVVTAAKGDRSGADLAAAKTTPAFDQQLRSQLDKLASQVAEPGAPLAASSSVPAQPQAPVPSPVPERQLSLQAPTERWGEQMLDALRDSVELQLRQNQQRAVIRLDPPELGRLDIHLHQDASRLTVQIHAAQGDVARMLQQGADRLRQDLAVSSPQAVEVQVSDGRGGQSNTQQHAQQGRPAPWLEEATVGAAANEQGTATDAERRPRDVLVTV